MIKEISLTQEDMNKPHSYVDSKKLISYKLGVKQWLPEAGEGKGQGSFRKVINMY